MLVCHHYNVCKNAIGSVYANRYGGLSEIDRAFCLVCFLVQ